MTSLNEHDQQLLQTLLSHADAVAPPADKPPQPEHNSSLDFNSSENDLHFWDNLINNGAESMQYEQQSSTSAFQGNQSLQQHSPETGAVQPAASVSTFQSQASPDFTGQQPGFTGVANQSSSDFSGQQPGFTGVANQSSSDFSGQQTRFTGEANQAPSDFSGQQTGFTGVANQASSDFSGQQTGYSGVGGAQTSIAGYQDQGHGYQQVQPSPVPASPQMTVNSSDTYQNQSAGFQAQQFPVPGGAMDQNSGQLEKPGSSLTCGFSSSQSQGFSQQYSMDTTSEAQSDVVGGSYQTQSASYQPQTHSQFNDSSIHLQAHQQQVGQTGGAYLSSLPNSSKEHVSHSASVYPNQNSDSQQQQTFLSEFRANNVPDSSLAALVQGTGFQQQYNSTAQSQPAAQERRDSSQQQQSMENFPSQLASYQQQPQTQPQTQTQPPGQQQTYQQGAQLNSSSTSDQSFHNSTGERTSLCFTDSLSAFSAQTGQPEQPGALIANTAVDSSGSLQATGAEEGVQHMQFQSTTPSTAPVNQDSAEAFQGQVHHYSKQQSFHSPSGSPAQPVASPPSYPQPSPDVHSSYSQSVPTPPCQGEQPMGLGYAGQTQGFPKQQSFSSPVASPDKPAVEGSVPNSPASSFQHHSPAPFSIKSPYSSAPAPLQSQGDQAAGSNFSLHTPVFSQTLPSPGDQNTVTNYQASAIYSNGTVKEIPTSTAGGFQAQDNLHSQCAIQSDSGVPAQSNAFQPSAFQSSALPAAQGNPVAAQPMQEGSGPNSIDVEAVAFLVQESMQSLNQQNQSLESTNSAVSYQQIPSSQSTMNSQRDQPMETQQSPCVAGSSTNTATFKTPAPVVQPAVFQETVPQASLASQVAGSSYLNQGLPFQAQPSSFQAPSSSTIQPAVLSSQSLPRTMAGLVSGAALQSQSAATAFASNSLANSFPAPSSVGFTNQTGVVSRQSANVLNSQTTSSVSGEPGVTNTTEIAQFTHHPDSSSSFSSFRSDAPTFGHGNIQLQLQQQQVQQVPQQQQVQHQQFSQLVNQQQTIQSTEFSSQAGGMSLIRNNSTHNLSSVVNENIQITPYQAVATTASTSAPLHTSHPVTMFGSQPFEMGQLQGQVIHSGPQEEAQNIVGSLQSTSVHSIAAPVQSTSVPNQLAFAAQAAPAPVSQFAPSPVTRSNIDAGKSAVASLQDSSQTNSALAMLSSVLMQIQSILPKATGPQKESADPTPVTPGRGENPEVVAQLLQSQNSATQILKLLQQQPAAPSQTLNQASQQAPPSQAFPCSQQQKQPVVNVSMVQQPNFLVQPGSSQQGILTTPLQEQQQQQAGQPQLPSKPTLPTPSQQVTEEIPASMVASLAGSLGSHGITIGTDGQLMIGNQSIKLLLDSSSSPASVNMVPASAAAGSSSAAASVSLPSLAPSSLAGVGGLPMDLQNVPVNLFPQAAATSELCASVGNLTHTINTTPTAMPNTGSNFSKNTTVMPTSSFTQPLSMAGVGMGLAVPCSSSTTVPLETSSLFSAPLSTKPQPATPVTCVVSCASTISTPAIANIFYPISSASCAEKRMDAVSSPPVPVGNFLNVTTGSASMLLNAFSMAASDGKQDNTGFKGFPLPEASASDETTERDTADMEIMEVVERASSPVKPMETDKPVTNLTPRHCSRKTSFEEELEGREDGASGSVLRRILTMKDEDGNAANSKAGSPTPGSSPVATPTELLLDGNTQATLIERSEKLRLSSEAPQDDDMQSDFWTSAPSFVSVTAEDYVPSKVHRGADDLDASSKLVNLPSVEKLFDAGGATSNSAFVFTKFGSEEAGVRTFGSATSDPLTAASSPSVTEERMSGVVSSVKATELLKLGHVPTASIRPNSRRQKDPALTFQFPSKVGEYELRILAQPEEQHRARYLTEGSRGAVKDKSQQGYPHIKLVGYNEPATLQVFIGSESGRVKPHGFYQACKVCGKNSTPCNEREIDGTNVIEIEISPLNDMQVYMDCVGILKLRNADVEKRIGPTKAKAKKKNSTKARLVFRCCLRKPDGGFVTLQVASTPILCTQPIGQPEICRLSMSEMCVNQTNDLFIIGKNFLKGTQIIFREMGTDEKERKWQSEAEIEVEYFQQTHLICRVPEYLNKDIKHPVACQIVAFCAGKVSDPHDFTYKPAMVMVKVENEMETEPSGAASRALPFSVSPVALQLNRLVERAHQHSSSSPAVFQLPPGAIPTICMPPPTLSTPPRAVCSSSSQPMSSILKPATLCLPASGQTLTLGPPPSGPTPITSPAPPVADGKGPVPVQFVLPSPGTVAMDSRQLGSQPTQLVLMPTPPPPTSSSLAINPSGKGQPPPVLTFTSMASTPSSASFTASISSQARTTSAPMILFLAGPPASVVSSSSSSSSMGVTNSATTAMPMSLQQSISNGQVESLLKQMLESSKPSS